MVSEDTRADQTQSRVDPSRPASEQLRVAYWPRWRDHPYIQDLYATTALHGVVATPASPLELARRRADIFHLHWPDRIWAGSLGRKLLKLADVSALLAAAFAFRRPIVVTVHNLRAHDGPESRTAHRICSFLLARADRIVALSSEGRDRIRTAYPVSQESHIDVIPLMDWRTRYQPIAPVEGHRILGTEPGLPGTTSLVWFGQIRAYKGLDLLVDLMSRDRDLPFRVLIVGENADPPVGEAIRCRVSNDERFTIIGRHVTDAEICAACSTADCAIFPFRSVENSASVLTALATDTPVIVPAVGAMPELAQEYGSGWVRTYDPPLDAEQLKVLARRPRPAASAVSTRRSLDHVGMLHVALFRNVVRG